MAITREQGRGALGQGAPLDLVLSLLGDQARANLHEMVERAATAQMLAEIQLRETDLPRWLARRDAELGRAVPSFAALAYFISDRAYLKPEDACRLIAELAELPASRSNQ